MQDEKIIEMFFERCEEGIKALEEKYGNICMKLSYNILDNYDEAEECVNDAYLAFWNSVPPERPESVSAYLCRIVRNISLSRYRKNNAQKRGSSHTMSLEELSEIIPSSDTVESEIDLSVLTSETEAFLDTLSHENSVVFVLRYFFGYTYKEISLRTGLREKTISVRLSRIRKALKKYLEEREVL